VRMREAVCREKDCDLKIWPSEMLKVWGGRGSLATTSGGVQRKMFSNVARLNEATQHTHKSE
jgi:hypothetical protein